MRPAKYFGKRRVFSRGVTWQLSCFPNSVTRHPRTSTFRRVSVKGAAMADYRRHFEQPRRPQRDWSDRARDEARSWFGNEKQHRGHDERDDRFAYGGHRPAAHDDSRLPPDG